MVNVDALIARIQAAEVLGFDVEYVSPTIKLPGRKPKPDPYRAKLHGFAVATLPKHGPIRRTYVPVRHCLPGDQNVDAFDVLRLVDALLERAEVGARVWAHNAAAELQALINEGYIKEGTHCPFYDSMVAAWLMGNLDEDGREKKKGDDKLALKHLRVKVLGLEWRPDFAAITKGQPLETVDLATVAEYCELDASDCLLLGEHAWARLDPELQKHAVTIDFKSIEPLRAMSAAGMTINAPVLEEAQAVWRKRADELREEFELFTTTTLEVPVKVKEPVGFFKNGNVKYKTVEKMLPRDQGCSISSSQQISRWCFDVIQCWPTDGLERNKEGFWPTDKETLTPFLKLPGLGGQLAAMRLEFNKLDKLISTYARPMIAAPSQYGDGRLHCSFKLTGTDTQRLSSSDPNLQNLPSRSEEGKVIRKAVVAAEPEPGAPPREIGCCDANQAELRIAAHLSRDEELTLCYELGEDIHAGTLAMMQAMNPSAGFTRSDAKIVNFSSLYNITANTLAGPLKMNCDVEKAAAALDAFYGRFKRIGPFQEWCYQFIIDNGYMRTIDGFRRPISNRVVYDKVLGRKALHWMSRNRGPNTAIQGSVAGLMKIAMINVYDQWRREGVWGRGAGQVVLIAQEHDSLVTDHCTSIREKVEADLTYHIENAVKLRVPFRADFKSGPTWAACK